MNFIIVYKYDLVSVAKYIQLIKYIKLLINNDKSKVTKKG